MAEPLDYRNPNQPADPVSSPTSLQQPIPIEFDSVLIQTADFSAARAIEVALRRNKIAAHVAKIGTGLKQQIEIYVRKDAHERAWQIAGKILARRQKLKSLPRQDNPSDSRSNDIGFTGLDIDLLF